MDKVWDVVERAGWSAGQQFVAILLATGTVGTVSQLPWNNALWLAVLAFFVSIILTFVQYLLRILIKNPKPNFWKDTGLRLAKTFTTSMLASAAAAKFFDPLAFDWETALNVAAYATLGALGKGLLARQPDAENPSTLPPGKYPTPGK